MKKSYLLIVISLSALILQACKGTSPAAVTPSEAPTQSTPTQQASTLEVYDPLNACDNLFLPMENGTAWRYSDGTILSYNGFNGDDQTGSAYLLRLNPDASVEKLYLNCEKGKTEIIKIGTLDKDLYETGVRTMKEITMGKCDAQIILPSSENILPGQSWQQCATTCRAVSDQTINIQLGTFKTRRVECEDGTTRWYAPQFGLLKTCTGKACSELVDFRAPN